MKDKTYDKNDIDFKGFSSWSFNNKIYFHLTVTLDEALWSNHYGVGSLEGNS